MWIHFPKEAHHNNRRGTFKLSLLFLLEDGLQDPWTIWNRFCCWNRWWSTKEDNNNDNIIIKNRDCTTSTTTTTTTTTMRRSSLSNQQIKISTCGCFHFLDFGAVWCCVLSSVGGCHSLDVWDDNSCDGGHNTLDHTAHFFPSALFGCRRLVGVNVHASMEASTQEILQGRMSMRRTGMEQPPPPHLDSNNNDHHPNDKPDNKNDNNRKALLIGFS